MRQRPKSILFLAHSLNRGGAERQLVALAKGLATRGHQVSVAVFYGGGAYETELANSGVRLVNLDKRGRWDVVPFLYRLLLQLRKDNPKVLHSYLGGPNIVAVAAKPLLPGVRIVWGVRASNVDLSRYDWLLRLGYWLECHLSHFADLIIANSCSGKAYAIAHGFPVQRMVVIPNGIDTQHFRFDSHGRERVRAEWDVREGEVLVGMAARLDPMKDHPNFLRSAAQVARRQGKVRFVCIGNGPFAYRTELVKLADELGLGNLLIWAGPRDDMPAVYSALDIACSASAFGEGFSNTIGEAMACGVPCVVTDVGDSALIVGDTGIVVPPSDPNALADGMIRMMKAGKEPSQKCRERIVSEFGVERLVLQTATVLGLP